jgi:membrane peptidoglycan carboxypeptidase
VRPRHKAIEGLRPVVFGPRTLWRTWGTRPSFIRTLTRSLSRIPSFIQTLIGSLGRIASFIRSFIRSLTRISIGVPWLQKLLSSLLLFLPSGLAAQTAVQVALSSALRSTPAVGLVVDVSSGRRLAAVKAAQATGQRSAPGSILKPLFLTAALERKEVLPQTTAFCRRSFHISDGTRDWNVACTHPQSDVSFAAREALAYSCNRYFAELADRIPPSEAAQILEHYGLGPASPPQTREQKELLVLGLWGIVVSPAQMAAAYRKLAQELDDARAPAALEAVRQGLADSVSYGMAHNAAVPGMKIAGKTGTASDIAQTWSHGWFAGTGYLGHEEVVIVIYLPHGNGADAARLAQHFFLAR